MLSELILASVLNYYINTQYLLFESEGVLIRLLNAQCFTAQMAEVLNKQKKRTQPRAAVVTVNGKDIRACWVLGEVDAVLIVDEDGATGVIPANAFKIMPYI